MKVIPSWLQKIPGATKHHRWLIPLLPLAFESFDLSEYDIVISITSAEAKGVLTLPNQLHICYLLTPTRYLYSHVETYLDASKKIFPGFKLLTTKVLDYIRWWDQAASSRPDAYISISRLVSSRLKKYYHKKAVACIYPPVSLQKSTKNIVATIPSNFDEFYLVVSRFVPYKGIDLAIKATHKLNKKLLIVGSGPDKKTLQKLAATTEKPNNIVFLENQSTQQIHALMKAAKALLMPGIEDFGITALESLAAGTPVILHTDSGAAELISHKKTGIHLQEVSVNGLIDAIEQLEQTTFLKQEMKKTVAKYDTTQFKNNIQQVVTTLWKEHYVKHT
jgi:glycosyltransferase involved in cell wall biosynthesis